MSRRTATDLFRRTLPLRKYQIPHFNQLLGHIREHVAGRGEGTALGYEAPMGSGKTTTIKALASLLLCGDLRLVVVAAPLDAIVEQWAQPGSWRTEAGECLTLPTLHRDAPRATAVDLRDPKWWATASGFYVTTRQAMCTKRGLDALAASRASLRRVLVVGDEGHHHGDGTLAGRFFEALRGRGAATLLVSGTPWHGTGSIFTPDTRVVRLSAAALSMCINDKTGHPFAPTQWQVERHLVPYKTSRVDLAVEPNKVASESVKRDRQYEQAMCRAAAEEWARLGCPRTVINVPWSAGWKQIIVAELQRVAPGVLGRPAVVVDLIGDLSGKARAEAQARLAADGAAMAYDHPARVDVVVSCARMNEGTDWPPCSHVFNIRIPCSPLLILQRWARASRDKRIIAGYPSQWVDAQTLVFFVPTLTGDAREDAWKQHREQAVLLAAYLADYQAASRWVDPRCFAPGAAERHVAGRKQAKGARLERAVGTGDDGDRRGGTAMDRSRAVAEIVERIRRRGPDGTMKIAKLDATLAKSLPDVSGPARKAALLSLYRTGEVADAVDAALARADRAIAQGQSVLRVREELQADLDAVVEKFGHFDVSIPGDLSKCVAKFTALDAKAVAELARPLSVPPWDDIRNDRAALEAFARERAACRGNRPTATTGACASLAGFSWGSLNNALRDLGSSLANALEHSPWYLIRDEREALEKYARTQAETRHARPTKLSGKCPSLGGWTWGALNYDLMRCNSSLSKALTQTISPYKQHARAIREWHETYGQWPRKSNGDATERTLGARYADMRRRAPEYLVNEGIPLAIDFSATIRRGIGKHQFASLAEVVILLGVQWRQSEGANPALNGIMRNAAANKSGTRGLCTVSDRCQVNGITRANAEIEADCWRFTLAGETAPDPRPWAELLASGDHKRIERAERVAFLDWKDSRLRGGTRWTDPRVGKGPKCPPAVRRPWTSPATAKPTNGT